MTTPKTVVIKYVLKASLNEINPLSPCLTLEVANIPTPIIRAIIPKPKYILAIKLRFVAYMATVINIKHTPKYEPKFKAIDLIDFSMFV